MGRKGEGVRRLEKCLECTSLGAQDIAKEKSKVSSKVLLDNDQVRVLQVESPVREVTGLHSHPAYVIYPLTDGKLEETVNGKTKTTEFKAGQPKYIGRCNPYCKKCGYCTDESDHCRIKKDVNCQVMPAHMAQGRLVVQTDPLPLRGIPLEGG